MIPSDEVGGRGRNGWVRTKASKIDRRRRRVISFYFFLNIFPSPSDFKFSSIFVSIVLYPFNKRRPLILFLFNSN